MITLEPYNPGDELKVRRRDGEAVLEKLPEMSVATTVLMDGEIVGVFGYVSTGRYIWDAWAIFSDDVRGCGLALTRKVRAYIEKTVRGQEVLRVHILVHSKRPEYKRWAELLGFHEEAYMEHILPDGSDAYMMVIIPEREDGRQHTEST